MREVKFGKYEVAVELSWELIGTPNSPQKSISNLMKTNAEYRNVKMGIIQKTTGNSTVGFVPAGKKTKLPSAAAWLATANRVKNQNHTPTEDWVVVEAIENDEFWLCAIKDGVPLPGGDIIGDLHSINDKLSQILVVEGFVLFTTVEKIAEEAKSKMIPVHENNFEGLVDGVVLKDKYQPMGPSKLPIVLALFGLIIAGFVGFYMHMEDERKKQIMQAQAAEQQAQQAKQQEELKQKAMIAYREYVLKAGNDLANKAKASVNAPSNADILDAWIKIVENLSINNNGWRMSSATCTRTECTIAYERGKLTTNKLLFELYPDIVFSNTDSTATRTIPVVLTEQRVYTEDDFHDLGYIKLNLISDFQKAELSKVNFSLNNPKPVLVYINKFDPTNVTYTVPEKQDAIDTLIKLDSGYIVGDFVVGGSKVWALRGLKPYLKDNYIGIKTMKIGLDATYAWTVEGDYVIKGQKMDFAKIAEDQINPPPPPTDPNAAPVLPGMAKQ